MKRYFDAIKSSFNHIRHHAKNSKTARKLIVFTLLIPLAFLLMECRSFDRTLLLNKASVDRSVKPMKVIVNYNSIAETYGINRFLENREINDIATVIKNNMSFETEGGTYYLSILIRKIEGSFNGALFALTGLTLWTICFLGVPMTRQTVTISLSAAIMSPDGRILKTYDAKGEDKEYAAMYWGYEDSFAVATYKALPLACKDLREQLKRDAATINKLIK